MGISGGAKNGPGPEGRNQRQQAEIQFLETQIRALKAMKAQVLQRAQSNPGARTASPKPAASAQHRIWSWRATPQTMFSRQSQIQEAGLAELNNLLASLDKRLQELNPRPKAKNELVARAVSWLGKNQAVSCPMERELFEMFAEFLSQRNPQMQRVMYAYLVQPPQALSQWESGEFPFEYVEAMRFVALYEEAKEKQPDNPLMYYCREAAKESLAALKKELDQTERWCEAIAREPDSFPQIFQEISNDLQARIRSGDEDAAIVRKRYERLLQEFSELAVSSQRELIRPILEVKRVVLQRLLTNALPVLEQAFPQYLMVAQQNLLSSEIFKLRHRQPGFVVYYQSAATRKPVRLFARTVWKDLLHAWTGAEEKGLSGDALAALLRQEPWDINARYEVSLGGKQNNDIYIKKIVSEGKTLESKTAAHN